MRGMTLASVASLVLALGGCRSFTSAVTPLEIRLYQRWQIQPGETIANQAVLGGLGDVSVALKGKSVYAPFNGKAHAARHRCVLFSSPEVPGYLFRLCGLDQPRFGALRRGEAIGNGQILWFAALRKQPDRSWALVEPSKTLLQRVLTQP